MSDTHTHSHTHDTQSSSAGGSHAEPTADRDSRYWLSLEQWGSDPEFRKMAETEFQSSPLREGMENEGEGGWARREFLKLMGASLAMASAGCLRRPVQKIVPYNKQPEEVTLGIANYYTSVYSEAGDTTGIIVKTKDGRPIKIEGSSAHPLSGGGTSVRAQAHILSLYDPERLNGPRKNLLNKSKTNRDTISVKYEDADEAIKTQLNKGGVALLTGAISSPSTRALIGDFNQAFGAKHYSWEAIGHEDVREANRLSYGEALVPFYRFDKATVIVSIDADFLGTWIAPTSFTKAFSRRRKDHKNMNKLVVFDSQYSLTGANADVRVRIKPSQRFMVVLALAKRIQSKTGSTGLAQVIDSLSGYAGGENQLAVESALLEKVADDLVKNNGQSLIVANAYSQGTPDALALQLAVNALNSALGNDGRTVDHRNALVGHDSSYANLKELTDRLNKGEIKTVILHKTNPAYSAPEALGFVEALKKAEMVITTADRIDETSVFADYVLPDNHSMESWSDVEITRGVYSIQQPTLRPLYDTRSFQLSLMTWAYLAGKGPARIQNTESYYDYVRLIWRSEIMPKVTGAGSFEAFWDGALENGFVGELKDSGSARTLAANAMKAVPSSSAEGMEIVLYPTVGLGDGTLANVSWLQELPDPVTKICWDNYASISIATAEKMHIKQGHMLEIKLGEKTLRLPANIQPGLHDEVIAIPVGYGRTLAGKVANNIGVNVFAAAPLLGNGVQHAGNVTGIENKKGSYKLANPQGHHTMAGRKLVVEASLAQYLKDPAANNTRPHVWNIWGGHQYNGHKWGMAIDLNQCTGCNACTISCQSENNVTVVGKRYVIEGREMAWIRIDRYYVGDPANAEVVFQPVMCQHCDNAPCESVCPVAATVHSSEGLNDMVYNRCVGTRYCSNNCPYKVRRFNWFNWAKMIEKPTHLALNPDVAVRMRGVMEKCTFCVQRIKAGKSAAKLAGKALKDGDIKTACQTACPTEAIVFGDMNDPESKVSKMFGEERSYKLLEEFHAQPAVRYMTKIRNNYQTERNPEGASSHKGDHA
jgi:MoCo/4Fe-4S cofactor protein with predicted Tat translocation signal